MPTIRSVLASYEDDREPIVIDMPRLRACGRRLCLHLGKTQPSRLTRQRLTGYLRRRIREGVQPQTVRREFIHLRAALRLAWRDGKIRRLPAISLPSKGQPRQRTLDRPEIERLRFAVAHCPALQLFVELGLAHGARKTAIRELTWDRVDFESMIIDYRAPHPRATRRKHRAVVPLANPRLERLLRKARKRATTEQVVELSATQLDRRFREAAAAAGLIGVTPHVFRHTVVTQVTRRVSLERASKLVGHKSIAVTQEVYEHLKVGDLKPAARAMARWLSRAS